MAERRYRVLVLAESAHPRAQSVSWVGWAHTRALAELADVHLVTRSINRAAILEAGLVEERDFTAIDLHWIEQPMLRLASRLRGDPDKGWTTLMALSLPLYYAFEAMAWRRFAPDIKAGRFDVVHRITPVSPTMPSLIARRCRRAGVPFVMGPINGGLPWPREFTGLREAEREWLSYVRDVYRLMPAYRSSRNAAAAILIGSRATMAQLPGRWRSKAIAMPENGVDPARFPSCSPRLYGKPLRALFLGRLVPYKGADIALEAALPFLRDGTLHLDIVGDGPERERLARMTGTAAVDGVTLHGRVAPDEVHRHLAQADILLFPSVREFGGGVVLEAMAMGVVPVVVAYGGPGELVTPEVGIAVPIGERAAIVRSLTDAVGELISAPDGLAAMAEAGRRRVADLFTWRRKAEQSIKVYDWVTAGTATRPSFSFF